MKIRTDLPYSRASAPRLLSYSTLLLTPLLAGCLFLLAAPSVFAAFFESFESSTFPPPGWTQTNTSGGSGWTRLPTGTTPLPGWTVGTSSVPAAAGAGSFNAYCTWNTGGTSANSQYLISPALNGLAATSTLSFWLRCSFTNYADSLRILISTNRPIPSDFIHTNLVLNFPQGREHSNNPPYTNVITQIGTVFPPGTRIYIAFHEWISDNANEGVPMELDVISSDLTPDPEVRPSPSPLLISVYPGEITNQVLTYANVGSGGFTYSNAFPYGGGGSGWISISPTTTGFIDRLNSLSITVTVNSASLPLGTLTVTNRLTVLGATNSPIDVPIIVSVIKRPQSLIFPPLGAQWTTNQIALSAEAQSALPVFFHIDSGPGLISNGSQINFSASGTVQIIATQPGNWYWAPVAATQSFTVSRVTPTLVISNLTQTFTGSPCPVTVLSTPPGLDADTTYNGSPSAPTLPGVYAVTARVDSALFDGTQTGTLTVSKGVQSINFPDPGSQFVTNWIVLKATAESGLPVSFSWNTGPGILSDGSNLSFTGLGEVSITASQDGDGVWDAAPPTTHLIPVVKFFAELTLFNLTPTYDGGQQIVYADTVPPGLLVDMDYNGNSTPPINAGSNIVVATVNDSAYQGVVTASLVIAKADQTINLSDPGPQAVTHVVDVSASASSALPIALSVISGPGHLDSVHLSFTQTGMVWILAEQFGDGNWNPALSVSNSVSVTQAVAEIALLSLDQTYDGLPHPADVTTLPPGLMVDLTYNGGTSPPVNVGSYLVSATVKDPLYSGLQEATLTITKADSLITFMPIPNQVTTIPCQLSASAASGEPVSFALLDGPASLLFGSILSFQSAGVVRVVASEPGNENWNAAPDVTHLFSVDKAQAGITLSALAQTYDGTPHPVTATTDPEGLLVTLTYGGSPVPPVDAGAYVVSGEVQFALYSGLAVDTLIVARAESTLSFPPLPDQKSTNQFVLHATASSGLPVTFSVLDGPAQISGQSNLSFTGAGVVSIVACQSGNTNWAPAPPVTNTFNVTQDPAVITLSNLTQVYDGASHAVTAQTHPSSLSVNLFYDGSPLGPIAAGSYAVSGVVNDVQYQGTATGTLRIAKADQSIDFVSLTAQHLTNQIPLQAAASSLLPVSFAITDGPGLISMGSHLSFTARGVVVVTARQAGDTNWNPAADVAQTVLVSRLATVGDYNNDGTTDFTVYNPATFDWYSLASNGDTVICWAVQWGVANFMPVPGDYVGNGGSQLTVFNPAGGAWYLRTLDTPATAWQTLWGAPGMIPVWGDYDGDGVYDHCVYASGSGNWYALSPSGPVISFGINWGLSTSQPVPGDYTGDGIFDLAVYDSPSGKWYIRTLDGTVLAWALNWGGPGMIPVPGDYNGDGIYDLALFSTASGKWYILTLSGTILAWDLPFGWKGAIPVPGDYDYDGSSDLAVYDPSNGDWYIFSPRKNTVPAWKRGWGANTLVPVLQSLWRP